MSTTFPDDILLPTTPGDKRPSRSRIVAFVPITIAIVGVAAILVGRVTAHEIANSDVMKGVDSMVTGSITGTARNSGSRQ
jgi:hypothetical protein